MDYRVKQTGGEDWVPIAETETSKHFCHEWVLVQLRRPRDPTFMKVPMPKTGNAHVNRNAMIIMAYFHPYTSLTTHASEHVPNVADLLGQCADWGKALVHWFDGKVLCQEAKRYIDNFLVVTRSRPAQQDCDNENSDDLLSDEELVLMPE